MDSQVRRAVTAISDPILESATAAGLQRLGWEVIYRATEISSLQNFIAAHTDTSTVIASVNFRGLEKITTAKPIFIDRILQKGLTISDHDLYILLEGEKDDREKLGIDIPPLREPALLFAGLAPRVGTTTVAYNTSHELSSQGFRTLFIDANLNRPSLSQRMEIFGVNRAIHSLPNGLDVVEIDSFESLMRVAEEANEYQRVVIDMGELKVGEMALKGQRVEDCLVRWALQSTHRLHLSSDEISPLSLHLKETLHWISLIQKQLTISLAIHPKKLMSKREEAKFSEELARSTTLAHNIYPYERRLERSASGPLLNLAEVAPKSPLRIALLTEFGLS